MTTEQSKLPSSMDAISRTPGRIYPDDEPADVVLAYALKCAEHHSYESRVLGNLRAGDLVRALRASPGGAVPEPLEMWLCEGNAVMLKPDRLYVFRVQPGCASCEDAAEPYTNERGDDFMYARYPVGGAVPDKEREPEKGSAKRFGCGMCGRSFATLRGLSQHKRRAHG